MEIFSVAVYLIIIWFVIAVGSRELATLSLSFKDGGRMALGVSLRIQADEFIRYY
jgi:hypothetical protein